MYALPLEGMEVVQYEHSITCGLFWKLDKQYNGKTKTVYKIFV